MRTLAVLVLLGALGAPVLGHPCRHRSAWRPVHYRHACRAHSPAWRPHLSYRYTRCFTYTVCETYGAWHYRPYLSLAPIYSRYGVIFTLDDEVFTRGGADGDGLPMSRTEPVGSRFLAAAP